MAATDDHPSKRDIDSVFKKLKTQQTNKICFDCGANNPTWASVSYGVYLCIDCAAVHRSLGVHITFIRSIQLDTSWSWLQLRAMQVGGNGNAMGFFRQHGCTTSDAQQKYHSRAATLYKSKIEQLAKQAMKFHGTKLHIDTHLDSNLSPDAKEVDFFSEHSDVSENFKSMALNNNTSLAPKQVQEENGSVAIPRNNSQRTLAEEVGEGQGPSVHEALTISPSNVSDAPKSKFIGAKKIGSKKPGLGAKKGGLGATRVQTNFAEIETEASMRDKEAETYSKNIAEAQAMQQMNDEKKLASLRLAYQDITLERQKNENQWKNDPKKAEQAERLGMGAGLSSTQGVSHSAFTDMKTIEQINPVAPPVATTSIFDNPVRRDPVDDFFGDAWMKKTPSGSKLSSWDQAETTSYDKGLPESDWSSAMGSGSKGFDDNAIYGRSRKGGQAATQPSAYQETTEAQSKYANAKSLSSDMFQGPGSDDPRGNLSRFEGATAIGSDDYFGTGQKPHGANYQSYYDVQDLKDGVRSGVSKVAGKLSSIATAAYSSVQDRYGY